MNDLKQKAQEFCRANGIMTVNDHPAIGMAKFAQSLIDKGVLVEAENVMSVAIKKVNEEFLPALNEIKASTVSSAGKEVTAEDLDDLAYFHYKGLKRSEHFPVSESLIAAYKAGFSANQFKSSPASTEQPKDTPQLGEVKTKQECLLECDFNSLNILYSVGDSDGKAGTQASRLLNAMDMFASQFKSNLSTPSKEISDQDLVNAFVELQKLQNESGYHLISYDEFEKWYRDQLKSKP